MSGHTTLGGIRRHWEAFNPLHTPRLQPLDDNHFGEETSTYTQQGLTSKALMGLWENQRIELSR